MINKSLKEWPLSIAIGLTRPEGADPIPINKQCTLDTNWTGWIAKTYLEEIFSWASKFKKYFDDNTYQPFRSNLIKAYNHLCTIIYI